MNFNPLVLIMLLFTFLMPTAHAVSDEQALALVAPFQAEETKEKPSKKTEKKETKSEPAEPAKKEAEPAEEKETKPAEKEDNRRPVNVNTENWRRIKRNLEGVGEVIAKRIVKFREENGQFEYVEDLLDVNGFGEKTLEKNRKYIRLKD